MPNIDFKTRDKAQKKPNKNNLIKKPTNEELREYAKVIDDPKHPFKKIKKDKKMDIEKIFIKSNNKK
tara:strand:+ start:2983 stop:3183 length:201 start_codon:yes stop_codon:yes gene_type:complete